MKQPGALDLIGICPPVIFNDAHVLVLLKPAGLLAVPGRGASGTDCLSARARTVYPDALVVHRLDQATSGLMVMARSVATQRALSTQFERRAVGKVYEAIVEGLVEQERGQIDLPLMADWPRRPMQKVDHANGKPSVTHWHVLARNPGSRTTRLALTPHTGRTHQLRVHLAAIGHPIAGDRLYGNALTDSERMMLHATELSLAHPTTGAPLVFRSPAPF